MDFKGVFFDPDATGLSIGIVFDDIAADGAAIGRIGEGAGTTSGITSGAAIAVDAGAAEDAGVTGVVGFGGFSGTAATVSLVVDGRTSAGGRLNTRRTIATTATAISAIANQERDVRVESLLMPLDVAVICVPFDDADDAEFPDTASVSAATLMRTPGSDGTIARGGGGAIA